MRIQQIADDVVRLDRKVRQCRDEQQQFSLLLLAAIFLLAAAVVGFIGFWLEWR